MKTKKPDSFERAHSQIEQLRNEVSVLSKNKPDNPINKFKLKLINEKLNEANALLTGGYKPFKDFTVFNEEDLPSNSDVVMILSQYLDSLKAWQRAHRPSADLLGIGIPDLNQ